MGVYGPEIGSVSRMQRRDGPVRGRPGGASGGRGTRISRTVLAGAARMDAERAVHARVRGIPTLRTHPHNVFGGGGAGRDYGLWLEVTSDAPVALDPCRSDVCCAAGLRVAVTENGAEAAPCGRGGIARLAVYAGHCRRRGEWRGALRHTGRSYRADLCADRTGDRSGRAARARYSQSPYIYLRICACRTGMLPAAALSSGEIIQRLGGTGPVLYCPGRCRCSNASAD